MCALLARAITPVGFMPAAISSGGLFALCHSDVGSRQLLALSRSNPAQSAATQSKPMAAHDHHAHHHGQGSKADSGASHSGHGLSFDQRCDFAASPLYAAPPLAVALPPSQRLQTWQRPERAALLRSHRLWLRPPNRAPPSLVVNA